MPPLRFHAADRSVWEQFAEYHYLRSPIHRCSKVYLAWQGAMPVGCVVMMYAMGYPDYWRVSRLAVIPQFQGSGIGGRLIDWAAEYYTRERSAKRVSVVTALWPVIHHCENSPLWHRTRRLRHGNVPQRRFSEDRWSHRTSTGRAVQVFVYTGEGLPRSTGRKS